VLKKGACKGVNVNGLYEFCWPSLYIAIRIMDDVGLCDGDNINPLAPEFSFKF
jgi:hypothetical protein